MALTAQKLQQLTKAHFDRLFEDDRDYWEQKTRSAYNYARDSVVPAEFPVRQDDVVKVLTPPLEVLDRFTAHVESETGRQKYWTTYFAEFLTDSLWETLTHANEKESDE